MDNRLVVLVHQNIAAEHVREKGKYRETYGGFKFYVRNVLPPVVHVSESACLEWLSR